MKKILVVFGTRPEAIKMCPLVIELKKSKIFEVEVCVTGQHRDMLDSVLDVFNITPDYDLNIMKNAQDLFDITNSILLGMRDILKKSIPDLVFVHGDTTTAYASSLASFYYKIDVGHVEAGLRTFNLMSPFPEEFNRQSISLISRFNFAPTNGSKLNLLSTGVKPETVFVTGNTAIDALKATVDTSRNTRMTSWINNRRMILLTAHRRESLGEPLTNVFHAVRDIARDNKDICIIYPVHKNPSVREQAHEILGNISNVALIEPLDVIEFHNLLNESYLILTDSGGIQEEAPSLGKPVLVLRETTERPEGIEAGTLKLVGTDSTKIIEEVELLLNDKKAYDEMSFSNNPYGDGNASKNIAKILEEVLS